MDVAGLHGKAAGAEKSLRLAKGAVWAPSIPRRDAGNGEAVNSPRDGKGAGEGCGRRDAPSLRGARLPWTGTGQEGWVLV